MIKLVAVDMDGTLLRSDGHISDRNANTIHCLQRAGVEFLICTGRSYLDALIPLEEKRLRASVVCMNGACVYDWKGTLLSQSAFTTEQVRSIVACCKDSGAVFDFMTDKGSYSIATEEAFRDYFDRQVLLPMAEVTYEGVRERFTLVTEEELFAQDLKFFKISVVHESPKMLAKLKEGLARISKIAIASSFYTNLELTHEDAQKGIALAAYAADKGIRLDETMAIGDSENDYSMLSMNLKYTVAMGNAMESVKKTAKCQTRTNDEDGVAFAIDTLVLAEEARAC